MLTIRHHPELATAALWAWLRQRLPDYDRDGRASVFLVESEPLPHVLATVAWAVCPGIELGRWVKVGLQGYQNGEAHTPCHTDHGATGFGFILSLGATRTFRVHRCPSWVRATAGCGNPDLDAVEVECRPGTVALMDEAFHATWHHGIPPEPEVTGERLSLVFRTQPGGDHK